MNWTVYTEALYAYFQLIHCIYIFLFRYFTSLHRGVSQHVYKLSPNVLLHDVNSFLFSLLYCIICTICFKSVDLQLIDLQ